MDNINCVGNFFVCQFGELEIVNSYVIKKYLGLSKEQFLLVEVVILMLIYYWVFKVVDLFFDVVSLVSFQQQGFRGDLDFVEVKKKVNDICVEYVNFFQDEDI